MTLSDPEPSRRGLLIPLLTAVVIAAGMLWLAGAPFDVEELREEAARDFEILAPSGELAEFPREFRWTAHPTRDFYEIIVRRAAGDTLFVQQGPATLLQLDFEPGKEPAAGVFEWRVRVFLRGEAIAEDTGTFIVR